MDTYTPAHSVRNLHPVPRGNRTSEQAAWMLRVASLVSGRMLAIQQSKRKRDQWGYLSFWGSVLLPDPPLGYGKLRFIELRLSGSRVLLQNPEPGRQWVVRVIPDPN